MKQVAVILLLVAPLLIGAATAEMQEDTQQDQVIQIGTLLEDRPIGEQVTVTGTVRSPPEDYTAESGNTYQQFRIGDGTGDILVFCSTAAGRTTVARGDTVRVTGTFKEFYGTLELFTSCTDIEPS